MTYKDLFVAEVKVNGKILRVKNNNVYLPFGSEYTLLLKNLSSKKASVNVSIDGQDVLDYHSLILEGDEQTELEGFLRGTTARNRFRFIHKTKQIQDHRGDRADDGLIRIEFAFEKPKPEPKIEKVVREVHHHYPSQPWTFTTYNAYDPGWVISDSLTDDNDGSSTAGSKSSSSEHGGRTMAFACAAAGPVPTASKIDANVRRVGVENVTTPLAEEGITVKGSECNQEFRYSSIGSLEQSQVIVIQLKGLTETGNDVQEPITVQKKFICSSCGKSSKSSFKFCPECGTFLE